MASQSLALKTSVQNPKTAVMGFDIHLERKAGFSLFPLSDIFPPSMMMFLP